MPSIRVADPRETEFRMLLQAGDDYAASLYPSESNHMLDVETLMQPQMCFLGIWVDNQAVGCGGFWRHADYVEIKRLWIDSSARGHGLSRILMEKLEAQAKAESFKLARLETGISQPEALGLYEALGYNRCAAFGNYNSDPLSVFMEKLL